MFNLKPENLVGDTNKLLFSILAELKENNNLLRSMYKGTEEKELITCTKVITADQSIPQPSQTRTQKPRTQPKSQATRKKASSSKTGLTKASRSKSKVAQTI